MDRFLEVSPAVESILCVAYFGIRHATHGPNVCLRSLLFIGWDCHSRQINGQVVLDNVKVDHVQLELLLQFALSYRRCFLLLLVLKHGLEGEFVCIQSVDLFVQRYDRCLCRLLLLLYGIFVSECLTEGL